MRASNFNTTQTETVDEQLLRTDEVAELWRNTFPDFEIKTPVISRWVMLYNDPTILLAFKRTYAKSKRFSMGAEDCIKYSSSIMFHESQGNRKFGTAANQPTGQNGETCQQQQ